jgi:hypothetical protein
MCATQATQATEPINAATSNIFQRVNEKKW